MKTFSGRESLQDENELEQFIQYVKSEGVTSYLEVGCCCGDTFHAVMSALPVGSIGVAVDDPTGTWGLPGSEEHLLRAAEDLRQKGYTIHVCLGDSRELTTIAAASMRGPYDLVFIDGDHSYEGVLSDWQDYGKLGYRVAFHDIAYPSDPPTKKRRIQVREAWDLIRQGQESFEIVNPGSQKGIGVLRRC